MSDRPSLPNTEALIICQSAIAWEVVRTAFDEYDQSHEGIDEHIKHMTNQYIMVFNAISRNKEIGNPITS